MSGDDRGQMFDSEAGGEQRLDEEHAVYAMACHDLECLRQGVVAGCRAAIDIPLESGRKARVEFRPAIAPDFDVEGQVDVHGLALGLFPACNSAARPCTAAWIVAKQLRKYSIESVSGSWIW